MDSSLLNVVFDDPFDGNYVKYENAEFWTSGSETMGLQLTETLNGILPIEPTEDFHKDDNFNEMNIQSKQSAFNYENFAGQHLANSRSIEIVTVNPNTDSYDTDSEDVEGSDDEDEDVSDNNLLEFDGQSQYSNATFRTRTDSSSIGDYESHTSDYDDDDEKNTNASLIEYSTTFTGNNTNNATSYLAAPDELFLNSYKKNRTLSTNTQNSDVDGFGLQFDTNNFDLAEFITKDDFQLHNTASILNSAHKRLKTNNVTPELHTIIGKIPSVVQVIKSENNDSESDSDVIVDVETVEVDEYEASSLRRASEIINYPSVQKMQMEEEASYVGNIKKEGSASMATKLENHKLVEKSFQEKPNFSRKLSLVPNKKQCDLLKGKFAKSKRMSSQKPIKTTSPKNMKIEVFPSRGKNLALRKHESVIIMEQNLEDSCDPNQRVVVQCSPKQQQSITVKENVVEETPAQKAEAVKRKLNLDEYKKRREGELCRVGNNIPLPNNKVSTIENKVSNSLPTNDKKKLVENTTNKKHSEAVTSIVKTLKEQRSLTRKTVNDPITEARNKVLRLQELKKAQQMRIIDSTISAKVPRVTKLPPLREIVKDTPYLNEENKKCSKHKSISEYEEIIVISASCNTDISIPPVPNPNIQPVNNATRSLLKSSALLFTVTSTFKKVKAADNTKLSTSSLIASIQDVVVKKTLPSEETIASEVIKNARKPEHHGEDKIIMHLRKDRIRERKYSIAIQTDLQPEFPPLSLQKPSMQHKSRERTGRLRKRQYRKRKDLSSSSSSKSLSDDHSFNSYSSTTSRSRDNSYSSSLERMRTYDSAIGTGGYSSRSSLKRRSSNSSAYSETSNCVVRGRRQRRTSYSKRYAARKRSCSSYSSSSYTSYSDRSRSPRFRRSRSRSNSRSLSRSRRSRFCQNQNKSNNFLDRNVSQPAVEERRIVYVGRIEQETTKDILRRKFLQYGTIRQISIHFKDTGMKYGFVTFERSQDAFAAIDNSMRDPQINMYDVSFGGRRAFCRSSYADLDNAGINTYQSYVFPQQVRPPKEEDSFEALLMKMKAKLNANKTKASTTNGADAAPPNVKTNVNNKI